MDKHTNFSDHRVPENNFISYHVAFFSKIVHMVVNYQSIAVYYLWLIWSSVFLPQGVGNWLLNFFYLFSFSSVIKMYRLIQDTQKNKAQQVKCIINICVICFAHLRKLSRGPWADRTSRQWPSSAQRPSAPAPSSAPQQPSSSTAAEQKEKIRN